MQFPIYRKYSNGKSYFKVESDHQFVQLQLIGKRVLKSTINVVQYPEQLLIRALISCSDSHIVTTTEEEYRSIESET